MKTRLIIVLVAMFLVLLVVDAVIVPVSANNDTQMIMDTTYRPASVWCSGLASYTTYHNGKPALFVYRGRGNPNPYAIAVRYNNIIVPDADYGVQTYTGPQIDLANGWIGYYIARRWYWNRPGWTDDWRWSVRGCFR